jgi:hypothetical protein
MSVFLRRIAAPVLALALAASVPLAGVGGPAFGLGILRRDGILVPFGSYNGGSWTADWPGPESNVVFPISLSDVPKRWWGAPGPAAPWTAFLLDGKTTPLALKKPEHMRVFCATQLGVKTDYAGGPHDPRDPGIPKDGLAIAGDAKLLPISPISLLAQDAKRMIATITDDFNKEEKLAASRFTLWMHPFGETSRQQYPIELEAFYRARESTPSGDWMTSYVEAVRRFPALPEDHECGLITFVRGWVIEREGKKPIIDLGARVTYCDRADVSFMLPFGRLLIDREPYWVYQLSSWRDEIYGVSRSRPEAMRPVLAVAGGGCPKDAPPPRPGRGRGRGGDDAGHGVGG